MTGLGPYDDPGPVLVPLTAEALAAVMAGWLAELYAGRREVVGPFGTRCVVHIDGCEVLTVDVQLAELRPT